MQKIENLIFGCSGSIGFEISKKLDKDTTLLLSRNKPKKLKFSTWKKIDLNKKILDLPKKADKVFFLSSPYYIKKNLKKNIINNEYLWLKKILSKIEINQFIYFSSSSVYLKNHPIGEIKLKCEKLLLKKKINILQIWRPFNIIGVHHYILSDHFHNLLIKNFLIKKLNEKKFLGNQIDRRGYSSVENFCKKIISYSKNKKSFKLNYGNSNTITVLQIALLFTKLFKKKYKRSISINFTNRIKNINIINSTKKIKTVNSNERSENLLKKYFLKFI